MRSCSAWTARREFPETLCEHAIASAYIARRLLSVPIVEVWIRHSIEHEELWNYIRDVIVLAALLHDSGKAAFKQEDIESIGFKGHELISAKIAQELGTEYHNSVVQKLPNMLRVQATYYRDEVLLRGILLHHQALRGLTYESYDRLLCELLKVFKKDIDERARRVLSWIKHLVDEHYSELEKLFVGREVLNALRRFAEKLQDGSARQIFRKDELYKVLRMESRIADSAMRFKVLLLGRYTTGLLIVCDYYAVYLNAVRRGIKEAKRRLLHREISELLRALRLCKSDEELVRELAQVLKY